MMCSPKKRKTRNKVMLFLFIENYVHFLFYFPTNYDS